MRRLPALVITLSLLPAATAFAGGSQVIRDCTDDGRLEGHYTQKQLRDALASIPSDVDEYTNCREVIRRASLAAAGGGKGGGGGNSGNAGGEFGGLPGAPPSGGDPLQSATPQERASVTQAAKQGGGPVQLTDEHGKPIGTLISPSQVSRRTGPGATDVPTPLLVAALLLALAALGAAAPTLRHRVIPRRGT